MCLWLPPPSLTRRSCSPAFLKQGAAPGGSPIRSLLNHDEVIPSSSVRSLIGVSLDSVSSQGLIISAQLRRLARLAGFFNELWKFYRSEDPILLNTHRKHW